MIEINRLHHGDCLELMPQIADNSIDCILTDPPYLYLKNQKLDRPFDETKFFNECKRVLKDSGFIVLFGRGTSFYRWNCMLADLGFKFKEEVVWDKRGTTSPVLPLGRVHESISIHTISGKINAVKVDFFEKYKHEPHKTARTVERIATAFGNRKTFDLLKRYYENQEKVYVASTESKFSVTRSKSSTLNQNRTIAFACGLEEGIKEQSIIKQMRDHYDTAHPTQKPVKLLQRLLALVSQEGDLVLDPFSGSGSTAIAARNSGRKFIGIEIDNEYYQASVERVFPPQQRLEI